MSSITPLPHQRFSSSNKLVVTNSLISPNSKRRPLRQFALVRKIFKKSYAEVQIGVSHGKLIFARISSVGTTAFLIHTDRSSTCFTFFHRLWDRGPQCENHECNFSSGLKYYITFHFIARMPLIDIPILAVCRIFVP